MRAVEYRPGQWLALLRGRMLVLLAEDTRPAAVAAIWETMGRQPSVDAVLRAVVSGFGVELTGMPPFGIIYFDTVSTETRLHAILRGELTIRSEGRGPGGEAAITEMTGTSVTTWHERILPGQDSFRLAAGSGSGGDGGWLPLIEGAVRLEALKASITAEPGGADHAAAAPEAPPVAAPEAPVHLGPGDSVLIDSAPVHSDPVHPDDDVDETIIHAGARAANTPAPDPAGPAPEPVHAVPHHAVPSYAVIRDAVLDTPVPVAPAAVAPTPNGTAPNGTAPNVPVLIDSVPWLAADRAPAAEPAGDHDGHTVMRSDLPAGLSVAAAEGQAAPDRLVSGPLDSDHLDSDGLGSDTLGQDALGSETLGRDLLGSDTLGPGAALPEARPNGGLPTAQSTTQSTGLPTGPPTGPLVLGRLCAQGHPNPPTSGGCTVCGQSLDGEARQVHRPSLGRMRLSSGEVVELDRSVVVGRQPAVSRVAGGGMPRLLPVHSKSGDISRSHLEVRLDGWHVLLQDLMATNGTLLIREGQAPRRLGQGEAVPLLDGDIADLGDDVSIRFEDLL